MGKILPLHPRPTHFTIRDVRLYESGQSDPDDIPPSRTFPIELLSVIMGYYIPDQQIRTLNELVHRLCISMNCKHAELPPDVIDPINALREPLEVLRAQGEKDALRAGVDGLCGQWDMIIFHDEK